MPRSVVHRMALIFGCVIVCVTGVTMAAALAFARIVDARATEAANAAAATQLALIVRAADSAGDAIVPYTMKLMADTAGRFPNSFYRLELRGPDGSLLEEPMGRELPDGRSCPHGSAEAAASDRWRTAGRDGYRIACQEIPGAGAHDPWIVVYVGQRLNATTSLVWQAPALTGSVQLILLALIAVLINESYRRRLQAILSCMGILVLSVQSYYRAQLRDARVRNDEQERILRDIHDLTSGKVVFFQDFKAFAQTQIPQLEVKNKALDIAEQALQLFKRISAAVRNSLESDSTLLEFLTQIVAESRKILGGNVIFSAQLVPAIPYSWVSGETKKQLRFVVQEVLGNILKHAEANKVSLTIAVKLGKLNITIQDDGKGIPEEVIAQIRPSDKVQVDGNGLGIMQGRILNLDGTIKWINDHGTKVFISISLQKVRPKRHFFSTLPH